MQIVLLSGGSGKRLWPISNDIRSKQFLKVLEDEQKNPISMAERVYSQIKKAHPTVKITIAANAAQSDLIREQLGADVNIVQEPERRNTFPAIVLACAYLALKEKADSEETIIVMPVDSFTELGFFQMLPQLDDLIAKDRADIALIGIKPTIPTSKYGYIIPSEKIPQDDLDGAYFVSQFVEKPDEATAAALIEKGAYWNGAVFAFKLGHMMKIAEENITFGNYDDLLSRYSELEKTSFDYKVVEQAERIAALPYSGNWSDVGTWRTLTDEMPKETSGRVLAKRVEDTYVINELDIPIIVTGTKNLIIAASPEGILISELTESSNIKPLVDALDDL